MLNGHSQFGLIKYKLFSREKKEIFSNRKAIITLTICHLQQT